LIFDRRTGRWTVGLLVAALCGLLLWFGLRWERGGTDMVDATAPAAGRDMVPPVDEDTDSPSTSGESDRATTDVIPPEEP
jgi:hypothetical protein